MAIDDTLLNATEYIETGDGGKLKELEQPWIDNAIDVKEDDDEVLWV